MALISLNFGSRPGEEIYFVPPVPRCKLEVIEIKSANSLPVYYCKVKDDIYLGEVELLEGQIFFRWFRGYLEEMDSLKVAEVFEKHSVQDSLLSGPGSVDHPSIATYYRLVMSKKERVFYVRSRKLVAQNWWGDFKPWKGELVELAE